MKFIFRFLIALCAAILAGAAIHRLVQSMPDDVQNFVPDGKRFRPEGDAPPFIPPEGFRPEGLEGRENQFSPFFLLGFFTRLISFATITFIVVVIRNILGRRSRTLASTTT